MEVTLSVQEKKEDAGEYPQKLCASGAVFFIVFRLHVDAAVSHTDPGLNSNFYTCTYTDKDTCNKNASGYPDTSAYRYCPTHFEQGSGD